MLLKSLRFVEITTITLRCPQSKSKVRALEAFGRWKDRIVIEHPNGTKETFESGKKQDEIVINCSWYAALHIGYTPLT